MNIFNSIRIILLLFNICMAIYIIFLTGQVIWINDINIVSTFNSSKVLHHTKYAR